PAPVLKFPQSPIERHLDFVRSTKRAHLKNSNPSRHALIVRVPLILLARIGLDRVWSGRLPNQEPERKGVASNSGFTPHKLSGSDRVGKPLHLLKRQHAEREPTPGCNASALPVQSLEDCSG